MALMSRKALVSKGALMVYLKRRLAMDAKVDLDSILTGVNAKNFKEKQPLIEGLLLANTRGKLAQDADIDDLAELLDALSANEEPGEDAVVTTMTDPSGGPPSIIPGLKEGEKGEDAEPTDTIAKIVAMLEGKVEPDVLQQIQAMAAEDTEGPEEMKEREMWNSRATDAAKRLGRDETPEERMEREDRESAADAATRLGRDESEEERSERKAMDKIARDRRAAFDKKAKDAAMSMTGANSPEGSDSKTGAKDKKGAKDAVASQQENLVTKTAMDNAIHVAVNAALESERKRQTGLRKAEQEVLPYVGKIAMDSMTCAEDVYKSALMMLKVDVKDMPQAAFRPVLLAQPKPGQSRTHNGHGMAMDTKGGGVKGFADRFPGAARIGKM